MHLAYAQKPCSPAIELCAIERWLAAPTSPLAPESRGPEANDEWSRALRQRLLSPRRVNGQPVRTQIDRHLRVKSGGLTDWAKEADLRQPERQRKQMGMHR